jgi:hypothetical protein
VAEARETALIHKVLLIRSFANSDLRTVAIVVNLEPLSAIAREPLAAVRMTEHRVSNRPAARVGVYEKNPTEILTPGLGSVHAIADCADVPAHRILGMVRAHLESEVKANRTICREGVGRFLDIRC